MNHDTETSTVKSGANSIYETMSDWKCPVCKHPVEQSGKGRPKEYHKQCRTFEQACRWLDDIIPTLPPGRGVESIVKQRLFNLANLANVLRYEPKGAEDAEIQNH
jgi:hypothetical protein